MFRGLKLLVVILVAILFIQDSYAQIGIKSPAIISSRYKIAAGSASPPTFDAASSTAGTNVASLTWSHTTSGSDRCIIVVAGGGDGTLTEINPSSVTYNGVGLTKLSFTNGTSWVGVSMWYLVAPATGTNNVVVTYTGPPVQSAAGAVSLNNVDQITPVDTADLQSIAGTGANPQLDITSTSTQMVIDGIASDDDTIAVFGSQNERWNQDSIEADTGYGSATATGSPTVNMRWSTANTEYAFIAVPINGK